MGAEYKKYDDIKLSAAFAVTSPAFPGIRPLHLLNITVMALPQPRQIFCFCFVLIVAVMLGCTLSSCKHDHKVYKSGCDLGINFKQVSFHQLMDSIQNFDQQYIEVSGKYQEDKDLSALFNDSASCDSNGLWVNFSQDCPLYLSGSHEGLFEYNDGQFTMLNIGSISVRGGIVLQIMGRLNI